MSSERPPCTCETFGNGVVSGNDGRLEPADGCPRHGLGMQATPLLKPALTEVGKAYDETPMAGSVLIAGRPYYFDLDDEPCTFGRHVECSYLDCDPDRPNPARIVAFTTVGKRVEVSTVWIGTRLAFYRNPDPPRIYETMIFGGEFDQYNMRYPTRALARHGHVVMVKLARNGWKMVPFRGPKQVHRRRYSRG